jgi:hypothetical protein
LVDGCSEYGGDDVAAFFESDCDPDNPPERVGGVQSWTVVLDASGLAAYDGQVLNVGRSGSSNAPIEIMGGAVRSPNSP